MDLLEVDKLVQEKKIFYFLIILIILTTFYSCKNKIEVINAGIGGNTPEDLFERHSRHAYTELPNQKVKIVRDIEHKITLYNYLVFLICILNLKPLIFRK